MRHRAPNQPGMGEKDWGTGWGWGVGGVWMDKLSFAALGVLLPKRFQPSLLF